jgi:uncharacterized protein (TIGR03435 family)
MTAQVEQNCRRVLCFVGAWLLVCAMSAGAQGTVAGGVDTDALGPAFEVAAVRPSSSDGSNGNGMAVEPSGRFTVHAMSVSSLFWRAYSGDPGQRNVTLDRGAPNWVESEAFDVNAKVDTVTISGWETMSSEQRFDAVRPMLRRLLADRFKVKYRVEMKPTPVYALVQAKGGAHVKEVAAPPKVEGDEGEAMTKWMAAHPGKGFPGGFTCGGEKCTATAERIDDVIGQIQVSSEADRMVVDETRLKGYYDFSFVFYVPKDSGESPMQTVADDLGMRFEPRSVPMKTYVIEGAEKPSVDGD